MEIKQDIVGTKCCMTCYHGIEGETYRCGKRERLCDAASRLYVDAFFLCPMWRPKKAGLYV